IARAITRYRQGRLSRREALRLLGAAGLTATAAVALLGRGGAPVRATASGGHGVHYAALRQEASGTPPPPPTLGEQPDGSNVWKVVVGGFSENEMDMIEAVAFLPGEITINAGDAIYFEFMGFHTVTFTSGAEAPPLVVPEAVGGTPAAGPPRLLFNPEALFPAGGDQLRRNRVRQLWRPARRLNPTVCADLHHARDLRLPLPSPLRRDARHGHRSGEGR
ncbi:MAG: hypothetical protein M3R06_11760, partial [Chloroflexota bacterium]|nr:hypothetical protein [Chloroflexota bacterium]